jgi:hypothetical protein
MVNVSLTHKLKAGQLGIYEFGKQLITTKDLDPVYVVLYNAKELRPKLEEWLLAYWCFYHCGTASWIVDQPNYWKAMEQAAASKEYKRSSERRHFRGQAAIKSVAWLKNQGIAKLFKPFLSGDDFMLKEVMAYVKFWYCFGDWIAFKVADMLERLEICKVVFTPENVFDMFEAPVKGAEAMAEIHGPATGEIPMWAYNKLRAVLGKHLAPPSNNRTINIQEIETILCKAKSHWNGHYPVGKDIGEVRHGILTRATCSTSQILYAAGKEGGLW